jgi:tetratricopeptide (TPR) repeat protein
MLMTRGIRLLAVGVALSVLAAGAVLVPAQAAEEAKPQQTLQPKVIKALRPAQEAMQKQDWETAYTHVQEALAVPEKQAFDDFQIAEMLAYIQLKREKYAEAAEAFVQSLNSGLLPEKDRPDRLKILTQLYMQLKDYPKAIEYGNELIESKPEPQPDILAMVGQAKYLSQDYRGAVDSLEKAVSIARSAGTKVEENWLQVVLSGYVQLKDAPGVLATLKELAVAYPKKTYLTDLFGQWKRSENDDRIVLNLYRVMFALNLLEFSEDYLRMAQLDMEMGFPGEAITVLERGNADKKFADEVEQVQYKKQLAAAKAAAVNDRKTLATLEQGGTKTGEDEVQLGVALASYEQYDKAVTFLQSGISKGGVKRLDQAQIVLGHALHKLNRTADSQAAFGGVDKAAQLGLIAALWKAYTQVPSPIS